MKYLGHSPYLDGNVPVYALDSKIYQRKLFFALSKSAFLPLFLCDNSHAYTLRCIGFFCVNPYFNSALKMFVLISLIIFTYIYFNSIVEWL